ncbi:MAG: GGDEF domain-containing protein [Methylococcales bacterium]|nr:GGDEF domain-containing protein [Methylococcales bacterium]
MVRDQGNSQLYAESATQAADLLRLIIPQISKLNLTASPTNYTIWYEYYLATNVQLKQAIDKCIENGTVITNDLLESFFCTYITDQSACDLAQVQENIVHLINGLSDIAKTADSTASNYQQSLQESSHQLENPAANQDLLHVVSKLISDTQGMQSSMQTMRSHMNESQNEINDLRNKLDQITAESLSDALTGLTNRKGFFAAFEKALTLSEVSSYSISLLMIDIDFFKKVNDTHGHLIGDKVIKFIADTLTMQIKGQDTASRFGGEEYVILLPNTPLQGAKVLAETIRQKIEKSRIRRSNTQESIGQITVSIGVACLHPNEKKDKNKTKKVLESLINRADSALYLSKENGRNRVTIDQP